MKTKTTNRRSFIRDSAILTGAVASGLAIDGQSSSLPKENPLIMTVGGPIQPDQLGVLPTPRAHRIEVWRRS
jgi:hypothetical protein